jgi:ribonuclease R
VTNFGFFVQLNDFFVEGLVHVTNLGNDYYIFDEARMTLTGRRTGRVFSIGTKVKIKLAAANILKRQLDFELLGGDSRGGGKHTAPPKKHFDHKHKQRHQKHRR